MNTFTPQKRAAAIHDLSGFGKCSLTVALPILSASGIEACALPTAILSTHTGGIEGYTYLDMTSEMRPFYEHWASLGIHFDALYSGFLGSRDQIDIVTDFFKTFKTKDNFILVDPVMADNGELYKLFDREYASGMKSLCKHADIIIPNLTEASLLLDRDYRPGPYTKAYIEETLISLSELGPSRIVLTGVSLNDDELGVATFDKQTNKTGYYFMPKIPGYYHGTGDIYGSTLLAGLLNDFSLQEAAAIAVRFTARSIFRTYEAQTDYRFGVNFEQTIPELLIDLNLLPDGV